MCDLSRAKTSHHICAPALHALRPSQGRAAKLNIAHRAKLTGNEHVRYDPRACASISASHHTTALRSMETRQARRPGRTPRPRFLSTSNTLRAVKCVSLGEIPARFAYMCYLAKTILGVLCQSRAVSAYPSQTFSYAAETTAGVKAIRGFSEEKAEINVSA